MRIKITGRGIYGNGGELPIGTELELKTEPAGWRGRYEVVKGEPKKDAVAITNPAEDEDSDDLDALRAEYAEVTGGHADKRWKEDTLREKIADAREDAKTEGKAS